MVKQEKSAINVKSLLLLGAAIFFAAAAVLRALNIGIATSATDPRFNPAFVNGAVEGYSPNLGILAKLGIGDMFQSAASVFVAPIDAFLGKYAPLGMILGILPSAVMALGLFGIWFASVGESKKGLAIASMKSIRTVWLVVDVITIAGVFVMMFLGSDLLPELKTVLKEKSEVGGGMLVYMFLMVFFMFYRCGLAAFMCSGCREQIKNVKAGMPIKISLGIAVLMAVIGLNKVVDVMVDLPRAISGLALILMAASLLPACKKKAK